MSDEQTPLILMYHSIIATPSDAPAQREEGADLYDVNTNTFKEQLAWLKKNGYKSTFDTSQKKDGHFHHVILTFDDGELNNLTRALPILEEAGFKAYFFIIGKRVGKPGYLNWADIQKLLNAGMIVGSHGLSHEILTNLLETQAYEELRASKVFLERNLNITVDSLSIPRGFCNNKIIGMAHQLGYKNIFISDKPKNLTQPCFSRLAVKGSWDIHRFAKGCRGEIPKMEFVAGKIKGALKLILKEEGYNQLRNLLVKTIK